MGEVMRGRTVDFPLIKPDVSQVGPAACERSVLLPVAVVSRWLLLMLSPLLSAQPFGRSARDQGPSTSREALDHPGLDSGTSHERRPTVNRRWSCPQLGSVDGSEGAPARIRSWQSTSNWRTTSAKSRAWWAATRAVLRTRPHARRCWRSWSGEVRRPDGSRRRLQQLQVGLGEIPGTEVLGDRGDLRHLNRGGRPGCGVQGTGGSGEGSEKCHP